MEKNTLAIDKRIDVIGLHKFFWQKYQYADNLAYNLSRQEKDNMQM